jgi:hypothetical protein
VRFTGGITRADAIVDLVYALGAGYWTQWLACDELQNLVMSVNLKKTMTAVLSG